jgi:hypothetical protein
MGIDEAIARFRAEPRNRHWLTDSLYLALPDPRAFDLLLEAAADPAESELTRCNALKVFHTEELDEPEGQRRVIGVAVNIVNSAAPDLVRDYAACALLRYADRPEVEAALVPVMLAPGESPRVRSAAFQVLSRRGGSGRRALFEGLRADPALGEEVRLYLDSVSGG